MSLKYHDIKKNHGKKMKKLRVILILSLRYKSNLTILKKIKISKFPK